MSQTPKCPGPAVGQTHCHTKVEVKDDTYDPTYAPVQDGVSGTGEELQQTMVKVVQQLEIITKTLHLLE